MLPQTVQQRETLSGEAGPPERRGWYAPSSDCTVFRGNYWIKAVSKNKPKMLSGLNQKVSGQVRGLRIPPFIGGPSSGVRLCFWSIIGSQTLFSIIGSLHHRESDFVFGFEDST